MWPCLDFESLLVSASGRVGRWVGNQPLLAATVPLLMSVVLGLGLRSDLNFRTDTEFLFVPENAPALAERDVIEAAFPTDYQAHFHEGKETRIAPRLEIILTQGQETKTHSIIEKSFWEKAHRIDQLIKNLTVCDESSRHPGYDQSMSANKKCLNVSFSQVCAKRDGLHCATDNAFLAMKDYMTSPDFELTYPVVSDDARGRDYELASHLGGLKFKANTTRQGIGKPNKKIVDAKALRLVYVLDPNLAQSRVWERTALAFTLRLDFPAGHLFAISSRTLEEKVTENMHGALEFLPHTVLVLVAFVALTTMTSDPVEGKVYLAVFGILSAALAIVSGWGLVAYMGAPWQSVNLSGLYLLLGVGLDDVFIILSAWERSSRTLRSVSDRLEQTYRDSICSISISTLTNIVTFVVGAAVPGYRAVRLYCAYTGAAAAVLYLWTLSLFGAALAWAGEMETQNRHHLLLVKAFRVPKWTRALLADSKQHSHSARSSSLHSLVSGQTIDETDSTKSCGLMGKLLPNILSKTHTKVFLALVYLGYVGLSAHGMTMLQEGVPLAKLVSAKSEASQFFNARDKYFRQNPYRLQVVIGGPLDYSNPEVRTKVDSLLRKVKNSPHIDSSGAFDENWLDMLDQAMEIKSRFDGKATLNSEEDLVIQLKELMASPSKAINFGQYVKLDEEKKRVQSSRFFVQSGPIKEATSEMQMVQVMRSIALTSSLPNVTISCPPLFLLVDSYLQVVPSTLQIVLLSVAAVFVVTFALLPKKRRIWTAGLVSLCIVSVEVGVIGTMPFFGIGLDAVSMISLAICVGFAADFSAHVAYHFQSAAVSRPGGDAALKHCLGAVGKPVAQSAGSTLLTVALVASTDSYVLNSFATIVCLAILYGAIHGLVILPALLHSFAPSSCRNQAGERRTLFEEVNKWRVKKTKESQLETTVTTSADVTIMSVEGIYRKLFHEDTPPLEDPPGMMREGGPDPPTPSFAAEQIAIRLEELKNPEGLLLDYRIVDTSL